MVLIFSEEKLSAIGSLVVEKHKGQTQGIRKVKWFILLVILCMAIEQVSAPKRPHYSLRKGTLKKSRESAKRAKIDQYDDESDTEDPIDDNGFQLGDFAPPKPHIIPGQNPYATRSSPITVKDLSFTQLLKTQFIQNFDQRFPGFNPQQVIYQFLAHIMSELKAGSQAAKEGKRKWHQKVRDLLRQTQQVKVLEEEEKKNIFIAYMKAAVLERVGTAGYLEQYVPVGGDERNLWQNQAWAETDGINYKKKQLQKLHEEENPEHNTDLSKERRLQLEKTGMQYNIVKAIYKKFHSLSQSRLKITWGKDSLKQQFQARMKLIEIEKGKYQDKLKRQKGKLSAGRLQRLHKKQVNMIELRAAILVRLTNQRLMSYKGIPELVPKVDCKGTYLLYEKRGQLDLLKNLMLSPIKKPRFESHTDPENPEGPYPGHPGARVGYEGDTQGDSQEAGPSSDVGGRQKRNKPRS